jgi:hypothetical protein
MRDKYVHSHDSESCKITQTVAYSLSFGPQILTLNSKLLSLNSLTSQSLCILFARCKVGMKPRAFSVVSYRTTALYSHATAFVTDVVFYFNGRSSARVELATPEAKRLLRHGCGRESEVSGNGLCQDLCISEALTDGEPPPVTFHPDVLAAEAADDRLAAAAAAASPRPTADGASAPLAGERPGGAAGEGASGRRVLRSGAEAVAALKAARGMARTPAGRASRPAAGPTDTR